jgi:hypothetical protein
MPYQLCFANETLDEWMDAMAQDAVAVAPGLGRDRARAVVERIMKARATQTTACGMYRECQPSAPLWPGRTAIPHDGGSRPCAFHDPDPFDLPNIFAVAAADVLGEDGYGRDAVEERLSCVFRAGLARIVFTNDRCGRAAVCHAPPRDPFKPIE